MAMNPDAHVVVTVSPVPLERTFSGKDIVIASVEGKSILRAAAAEFSDAYTNVTYFPAYELVTMMGEEAYQGCDLRHVNDHVVQMIMKAFMETHVAGHIAE